MSIPPSKIIEQKKAHSVEAFLTYLSEQGISVTQSTLFKEGKWFQQDLHAYDEVSPFNLYHLTNNMIPSGSAVGIHGNLFHYLATKDTPFCKSPFVNNVQVINYSWSEEVYQQVVQFALELGIDINAIDTHEFFQQPALCHAIAFDNLRAAKALIQVGGDSIDLNRTSIKRIWAATPLILAIQRGHRDIIQLLLNSARVDVNKPDAFGLTPLHWAAIMLDAETIVLLLQRNASPLLLDKQGKLPADYLLFTQNDKAYLNSIEENLKNYKTKSAELRPIIAHMWDRVELFIEYLEKQLQLGARTKCYQLIPKPSSDEIRQNFISSSNIDYNEIKSSILTDMVKRLQNLCLSDDTVTKALMCIENNRKLFGLSNVGAIISETQYQLEQVEIAARKTLNASFSNASSSNANMPSSDYRP